MPRGRAVRGPRRWCRHARRGACGQMRRWKMFINRAVQGSRSNFLIGGFFPPGVPGQQSEDTTKIATKALLWATGVSPSPQGRSPGAPHRREDLGAAAAKTAVARRPRHRVRFRRARLDPPPARGGRHPSQVAPILEKQWVRGPKKENLGEQSRPVSLSWVAHSRLVSFWFHGQENIAPAHC